MADTVAVPIIDINGRATTVHRSVNKTKPAQSRIPTAPPSLGDDKPLPEITYVDIESEPRESLSQRTYEVSPENIDKAKNIIDKANRRLERSGATERFSYTLEEKIVQENGVYVPIIEMHLNKPVIGQDGWTFTATHEFTPSGDVISYWGTNNSEDHFKPSAPTCDQCGANRKRERVYTITHDSGDSMQIGSSCISSFLGLTPKGLWSLSDSSIDEELSDIESLRGTNGNQHLYDALDVVSAALDATSHGSAYVSRANASKSNPATATAVAVRLGHGGITRSKDAQEVIDFIRNMPDDGSDYVANLKAVFSGDSNDITLIKFRNVGIAASAVSMWYRSKLDKNEVEGAPQQPVYKQEYIGTINQRIRVPMELEVIRRVPLYSDYGPKDLYVFKDTEGRLIKFAGTPVDVWEGGTITMDAATVKEHSEYRGNMQTTVNRPKFQPATKIGQAPEWAVREILTNEIIAKHGKWEERQKALEDIAQLELPELRVKAQDYLDQLNASDES